MLSLLLVFTGFWIIDQFLKGLNAASNQMAVFLFNLEAEVMHPRF